MYCLPSSSKRYAPSPRLKNTGSPPTPRKARTGELTPPGMRRWACWNKSCERVMRPPSMSMRPIFRPSLLNITSCSLHRIAPPVDVVRALNCSPPARRRSAIPQCADVRRCNACVAAAQAHAVSPEYGGERDIIVDDERHLRLATETQQLTRVRAPLDGATVLVAILDHHRPACERGAHLIGHARRRCQRGIGDGVESAPPHDAHVCSISSDCAQKKRLGRCWPMPKRWPFLRESQVNCCASRTADTGSSPCASRPAAAAASVQPEP